MPSVLAPISSISSQYPLHPGSLNQDKWGSLDQPQPGHDLPDIGSSGERNHNFDMNRLDVDSVSLDFYTGDQSHFKILEHKPIFIYHSCKFTSFFSRSSMMNNRMQSFFQQPNAGGFAASDRPIDELSVR